MRKIISQEELMQTVPAIFTETASPAMSKKYNFVSTKTLLDNFKELDWYPVQAKATHSKKASEEFSKHMVRLTHTSYLNSDEELIPEAIAINSHGGQSKLSMGLGIYRLVCSNGLMVGKEYASFRQVHMGISVEKLQAAMQELLRNFTQMMRSIKAYQSTILTDAQKTEFAKSAIKMIYNADSDKYEASQYTIPRRKEDEKDDLFTVFNVIQEHIFKGGLKYNTLVGHRTTKPINSIGQDILINTLLWKLMSEYAISK